MVGIGMISVVTEEEEEDKNMESYEEDGSEHGYERNILTQREKRPPSKPQTTRATKVGRG